MKFFICFAMLVSNAAAAQDMSAKMFTFPEETDTAHVRLIPAQTSFSAATVCHRSFTDLKRDHVLFSLATPSRQNALLITAQHDIKPHIQDIRVQYGGLHYSPNQWHSICTTWDSDSGLVQLWFNGIPLTRKYTTESPFTELPNIILGQEQDSYGGGFVAAESFVGMMTDVHMWNYVLSSCEIQKYMKELNFTPGNVLNWAALNFEITGRVLIEFKQTSCN